MIQLTQGGAYLVNGTDIVADTPEAASQIQAKTGITISKEEAAKNTMAYGILQEHNTSGNMDKLKIRFDKLTSHDITFVGIIQTARASGLQKFPMPYVLTNCHNSLCAVGGTINEDDHMFGLCEKIRRSLCTPSSGSYPSVCQRDVSRRWQDDPGFRFPYPLRCTGYHGYGRGWSRAGKTAAEPDL